MSEQSPILEALRDELVAASRRLSAAEASPPPTRSAGRVKRWVFLAGALGAATATAAFASTPLFGDGTAVLHHAVQLREAGYTHPQVRAFGLDPATARVAFDAGGVTVSVVRDATAGCVLLSSGVDHCSSQENIEAGRGFSIDNDCSAGDEQSTRISGLAPAGSSTVTVTYSAGAGLTSQVVHGSYLIEATTPAAGEPFPTALEYRAADGALQVAQPIIGGQDLCMTGAG